MRHASLKQTLLRGVSLAVVHVASRMSPVRETAPSFERGTDGFLARIGLWLRLIFGLGAPRCESVSLPQEDYAMTRHRRRAFAHRAKRRASARKAPAHDLEMLMGFVPGARRGLTLNQYRERFTRISVLGRAGIYYNFLMHRLRRQRSVRVWQTLRQPIDSGRCVSCSAPLWPD